MNRFGALRGLSDRRSFRLTSKSDRPADPMSQVGDLVDEVVRAADRAADEARAQADAIGAGRADVIDRERLAAELMKSLVERTESLRSQANELARVLERAAPLVADALAPAEGPPPPPEAAPPQPPAAPPAQPASPAPAGTRFQSRGTASGPSPGTSKPPPSAPSGSAASVAAAPSPTVAPVPQMPPPALAPEPEPEPEPEGRDLASEPVFLDDKPPAAQPLQAAEPVPEASAFLRPAAPPPSEGIRLLATQMAVAGSTHAEIEQRLRGEFGVTEADEILADVFGEGEAP